MINSAFQTLSKRRMTQVVCVLFVLFGFLQSIFSTPSFGLGIGYCVIWLLLLYIFGAYIRCYMPPLGLKKLWLLPLFAVSVIPSWISRVWGDGRFLSYCSPSVLVSALALTLFFINTDFKSKTVRRIIFAVSPTTLGVYLIHTQPLVFRIYLKDFFAWLAGYSTGIMIVYVLLFALAIFVVCSLIDMVRIKIFELLHINKIAKQLDSLLADK